MPVSPAITRFLAFAAVSGLGWIVDTAVTVGLHAAGLPLFSAALIGGSVAAGGVFLVSRRRIFAAAGPATGGLALYLAYSATMIILAGFATTALAEIVRGLWAAPEAAVALAAKVVVTPPLLALNFTTARLLAARAGAAVADPQLSA